LCNLDFWQIEASEKLNITGRGFLRCAAKHIPFFLHGVGVG
jgi:hypothetical protein